MSLAKQAADWIHGLAPNTLTYPVALPSYASVQLLYGDNSNPGYTWGQYVNDFVSLTQPQILIYDDYPFLENGSTRATFFRDLMVIRAKGLSVGIPYFSYIQTWAYPGWRFPSESDVRMQVYSYLAAGYKGIAYFTYDQYNHSGGLIDRNGRHTALYDIVKFINHEVKVLGVSLRFLTSRDVRFIPGRHGTFGTENPSPLGLQKWSLYAGGESRITGVRIDSASIYRGEEKNGLIGFFSDDDGKHYFMLVNLNHGPNLSAAYCHLPIWVTFHDSVHSIYELDMQTGGSKVVSLNSHQFYVDLRGGTGRLYKIDDGSFPPNNSSLNILSVEATDITDTTGSIHFVFNQKAQGQIEYGVSQSYGQWSVKEESFNFSNHLQVLRNLTPGRTYHYRVHGWDGNGNEVVSEDHQFITLSSGSALDILSVEATDITDTTASIHFVFNQKAQGQVEYGVRQSYGQWSVKEESFNFSDHLQVLRNLTPGTTYHYLVHGWDANGNEVVSEDHQFTSLSRGGTLVSVGATDKDRTNDSTGCGCQAASRSGDGLVGLLLVLFGLVLAVRLRGRKPEDHTLNR